MNSESCYVYIDRKPNGIPFYVGKGSAKRVAELSRNTWHSRICKKYPTWYRQVIEEAEESLCLELEEFLIQEIGRRDLRKGSLVNLTDGGEKGLNRAESTRLKVSKSVTSQWESVEGRAKLLEAFARRVRSKESYGFMSELFGDTVWINNGETTRRVKANELENGLTTGWSLGRLKLKPGGKKGYSWINNGDIELLTSPHEVDVKVANGWVFGRLTRNFGRTQSNETRLKISKALSGKPRKKRKVK